MPESPLTIYPIGHVESPLVDLALAPKQGDEGAPDAWIAVDADFCAALDGLEAGAEVFVLTWLDRADRSTLAVHPRDDPANPVRGVFATRSQDRPNPIGLHRVEILAVEATRIQVRGIEALDGTPVVDIKPTLQDGDRR
jgi:tRNA-Thr(GGU) m(6)t(6)A37 methyltransferase TsaA